MAVSWTWKYVSSAAGGGGAGTSGDPWTLAEGISNQAAAQVIVVIDDGAYTITSPTSSVNGTASAGGCVWVGCPSGSVPTDWDEAYSTLPSRLGFADKLDETDMPVITVQTDPWVVSGDYVTFMGIKFQGNLSGDDIVEIQVAAKGSGLLRCSIHQQNTSTTNQTRCVLIGADSSFAIHCDFLCDAEAWFATSSNGACYVSTGNAIGAVMCRFETTATTTSRGHGASLMHTVFGSVFVSKSGTMCSSGSGSMGLFHCTFYGDGSSNAKALYNNFNYAGGDIADSCHFTDLGAGVYAAGGIPDKFNWFFDCRSRDIANGIFDTPYTAEYESLGEVTTDDGDETTDYVDASGGDFGLKSTAAGYSATKEGRNIGAEFTAPSGGGGGTTVISPRGHMRINGGLRRKGRRR